MFAFLFVSRIPITSCCHGLRFRRSLATRSPILIGRECVRACVHASSFGAYCECVHRECIGACRCSANKQEESYRERDKEGGDRWLIVKTSWCGSRLSASYYFSDSACEVATGRGTLYLKRSLYKKLIAAM